MFVATVMALRGKAVMALGVLVQFDALLRVSELCGVVASAFAFSGDVRLGAVWSGCGINLRKTKTGPKFAEVKNPALVAVLRRHVSSLPGDARVFPFSPAQLLREMAGICERYGLPHYTTHSLRHGMATRLFLQGVSVEDIRVRGRWKSSKSMDTYLQANRAIQLSLIIPPVVPEVFRLIEHYLEGLLSAALPNAAQ